MLKEKTFQVPNLERGLQILNYLTGCEQEVSISGISREMGFPLNSVMRIMNALGHYGYVLRNPETKGYQLSNKMMTMSAGRASQKNLMEQSLDVMRQLRDETGETVVISVMDQDAGLVLEQVQGLHPFRFVCDPGTRQATHASSSTKAILAFMDDAERNAVLGRIEFPHLTDASITSLQRFRKELVMVAEKGYALDRAEALEGVHCVGAPVLDALGRPVAAITVTGPAYRLKTEDLDGIGKIVREHAGVVSRRLGYGL
jgi:IclR family acetate operon transcriptional repressor